MAAPFVWTDTNATLLEEANLNKHFASGSGYNVLENGSFELWSSGVPAGWQSSGSGTLSAETNASYKKHGEYSAKIVKTTGTHTLRRYIVTTANGKALGYGAACGATFTLSGWLFCNIANSNIQIYFYDGSTYFYTTALTAGGTWTEVSITGTTAAYSGSSLLEVGCYCPAGAFTAYFDALCLTPGEIARPYVPNFRDVSATDENTSTNYPAVMHHYMVFDPWGTLHADLNKSSLSDSVAWTAVDIPSITTNWCNDNALAVLLKVECWDSGAAGTNCYVKFREKNDSDTDNEQYISAGMNGEHNFGQIWVGLDTGGELEWWVEASGSGTAAFKAWPIGYLRPL